MKKIWLVIVILALGVAGAVMSFYLVPALRSVAGTAGNTTNATSYWGLKEGLNLGPLVVILFVVGIVIYGVWRVLTAKRA